MINFTEAPFDLHFTDKAAAKKAARLFGGRVRNESYRLSGSTLIKMVKDHYAVRVRPRGFAHKIEIMDKAKELGAVKDPWKY